MIYVNKNIFNQTTKTMRRKNMLEISDTAENRDNHERYRKTELGQMLSFIIEVISKWF